MRNNIIALWMVHGECYESLKMEAKSDAQLFGVNLHNNPWKELSPDEEEDCCQLQLLKCSPAKINNGMVITWKGWAVITWGYVEPQLLLTTIAEEEHSILQRHWLAALSSSPQ